MQSHAAVEYGSVFNEQLDNFQIEIQQVILVKIRAYGKVNLREHLWLTTG